MNQWVDNEQQSYTLMCHKFDGLYTGNIEINETLTKLLHLMMWLVSI